MLCDRPLERPKGETHESFPSEAWAGTDHRDCLMSVSVSTIISLIWPLNHTTGWLPTAWEPSARGLHIALWDCDNYLLHPCHLTPTPAAALPEQLICSMCHSLGLCCRCLRLVWKSTDVTSAAINSLQIYCHILNIIAPVNHWKHVLGLDFMLRSLACACTDTVACRISPGEPWESTTQGQLCVLQHSINY